MSSQHRRTEVFLHPGEWHFGGSESLIRTLLGSCVSIVLWHPRHRVGGMCHYLLAQRKKPHNSALSGRYADEAVLLLVHEILRTGLPVKEFQAKLIGGAETLSTNAPALSTHDVAGRNIEAARSLARQMGFTVLAEDLGGRSARLVLFDVENGDVWVRQSQEPVPEVLAEDNKRS